MSAKKLVKRISFAIALVLVAPLIGAAFVERVTTRSEQLFTFVGHLLAIMPGIIGVFLRSGFYFGALERCSWEVHIGFGSIIGHRDTVLDRHVSMGNYCVIGHVCVGEGTRLASRVSIPSGKRQHLNEAGQLSPVTNFERVCIGEGAWIGEGAVVMAAVGDFAIVSAGAIVLSDVPNECIAGGNPARVIGKVQMAVSEG